jgi:predicted RNA-binding Zn-ribbon protein involved in translation (DUF1610 family)
MPITVEQLIQNPRLIETLNSSSQKCPGCGVAVQETITGKRWTPQGYACSDCYYEELGADVEAHPIATGGVRRG